MKPAALTFSFLLIWLVMRRTLGVASHRAAQETKRVRDGMESLISKQGKWGRQTKEYLLLSL